ncbi:MFS transporter [Amycolatopsis sp. NPDC003861]
MLTGVALFSPAAGACAAPTPGWFGAARFAAGLGLGGLLPSAIAMVMEYAPAWRRNLAVTTVMTAHQAGGAPAGALGMTLVQSLGWRSVYWLGALLLVPVLPAVVFLLPESLTFLLSKGRTERAQAAFRGSGWRSPRPGRSPVCHSDRAQVRGPARALHPGTRARPRWPARPVHPGGPADHPAVLNRLLRRAPAGDRPGRDRAHARRGPAGRRHPVHAHRGRRRAPGRPDAASP